MAEPVLVVGYDYDEFRELQDAGAPPTVKGCSFVTMYYSHPCRLAKSLIAKQNRSNRVNAISNGSPSRIRMVRRISLGMTTRPRSSILRTIPVAFIIYISFGSIYISIVCKRSKNYVEEMGRARMRMLSALYV